MYQTIEKDFTLAPTPTLEKRYVWLVEDNQQFSKQLHTLINLSAEFECAQVFNSVEPALDLLRKDDLPDLILMDIGLPGMSGIEGVKRVKAIAPSVEVVILTVHEDSDNLVQAIAAGASGYLHKSSSLEEIVESLQSILAGGAPINPHIAKKMMALFAGMTNPKYGDYHLSSREKEILKLLVEGFTKKEIAHKLFLSFHTIDNHLRNIYSKLQVQSRSGAVAKALKERLL